MLLLHQVFHQIKDLVGTDAHRKYVETMVRGSSYGKQFINKYKVRK